MSAGLHSFLEALEENPLACLFQLLEPTHVSGLVAPSVHLQSQQSHHSKLCFCRHIFSDSDSSLPFTSKDPCGYVGPTRIIQDSLPIWRRGLVISNLNLPLPRKIPHSQAPGIRLWTSWERGALFYLPLVGREAGRLS